jgi:hypothetical protein
MQLGIRQNVSVLHPPKQWRNFEFWPTNMRKVVGLRQPDLKHVTIERKYEQPFHGEYAD